MPEVFRLPDISGVASNRLLRELQALEAAHPELQSPTAPPSGSAPSPPAPSQNTHRRPVLSLATRYQMRGRVGFIS